MAHPENLGSYIRENKELLQEYIETRLEIVRLQGVRAGSKAGGQLVWLLVSMFLLFLVFIFAGLVLALWLSDLTGSYIRGFGYSTLILIGITLLVALFRKPLFIDPAVRTMIRKLHEGDEIDEKEDIQL
jgi:hypothetical protein